MCIGVVGFFHNIAMFNPTTVSSPLSFETPAAMFDDVAFPGQSDEILHLPGKPENYTARMFSGFLDLPLGGKMFYFLAMSQAQTMNDPLMLWLNGGPGASSLFGCFSELGPLNLMDDGVRIVSESIRSQFLASNPIPLD
jgi:hypothetical protein